MSKITDITCGGEFVICKDENSNLYSFGQNTYGQLGITGQNAYKESTPKRLHLSRLAEPEAVSAGEEHAALVTKSKQLWTWGYGNDGQLGHGNKNSLNTGKHLKIKEKVVGSQ